MVQNEIDDRRALPVRELGGIAADGRSDDREDARADDDADTEGGKRDGAEGLLKSVLRALGVGDELIDGLGSEDLAGQGEVLVGLKD